MSSFDMMLSGQSSSIDNKKMSSHKTINSPILYKKGLSNSEYTFVVDESISIRHIEILKSIINTHNIKNYQILYTLQVLLDEKDLKKTIWKQYRNYKINFKQYISPLTKIISFGRSIFSLTDNNDLDCSLINNEENKNKKEERNSIVQGFYDTILWKTNFYHPELKCQIFPVDKWKDLINEEGIFKNSFEYFFLNKQIALAIEYEVKNLKIKPIQKVLVENPNEWLLEHSEKEEIIGYDIETGYKRKIGKDGFDAWNNDTSIRCITIAFKNNPYVGYYLRYKDIDKNILKEFLKKKKLIGTNLKFDGRFTIYKNKFSSDIFQIYGDTIQLQQICNELFRKGLKSGAWLFTNYGGYDKKLDEYIESHPEIEDNYALIPEEILIDYAASDPCISLLVHEALCSYRDKLDSLLNKNNPYGYSLKWIYEEVMIPSLNMYLDLELKGLDINFKVLKEQSIKLQKDVDNLEEEILNDIQESKDKFNINSNDQLGLKIKELGWKIRSINEKGFPNTGETQLKEWEKDGQILASKILKYRGKKKLLTTYVGKEDIKDGMYQWIRDDNKVHSLIKAFEAQSLRGKSANPNGQNYPSHGDKSKLVRSFLQPPSSDYIFGSSDYSGLQLRIITILSKDAEMVKAFKYESGDIHSTTSFNVLLKYLTDIKTLEEAKYLRKNGNEEIREKLNDFRFKSKSLNFGFCFGAQPITIMNESIKLDWKEKDLDLYIKLNNLSTLQSKVFKDIAKNKIRGIKPSTLDENILNAKYLTVSIDVRKKFFDTYKGLENWIEETRNFAKKNGYVQSLYGSIRRLPYLLYCNEKDDSVDINWKIYSSLLNIALNSPVQSMESIIIHRSMNEFYKWSKKHNRKDYFFLQIHDAAELMIYKRNKEWLAACKKIHEIFEKDYIEFDGIPFECETCLSDYFDKGQLWDIAEKFTKNDFNKMTGEEF